jgi:tRNA(fMet)-specific endonuclease VapC
MFCLDTNIVIFGMNGRRPKIAARLDLELAAGAMLIIPAIVRYELEFGCAISKQPALSRGRLEAFLSAGFDEPPFDLADAREAGEIRAALEAQGTPIGPYDNLIAAQARRRGAILVTLNRSEFERVPGLIVADWAG